MKVLVTGVKGQLGHDVVNELEKRGHTAVGVDIEEMDITDFASVEKTLTAVSPEAVIHCAAWTAVDAAEDAENQEKVHLVNAIGTETITSPVLDAVLTLAKRLNMLTVAEGVETPEQARWLSERGVNFMQGYWISRPLPLDDFVRWLKKPYTPQW